MFKARYNSLLLISYVSLLFLSCFLGVILVILCHMKHLVTSITIEMKFISTTTTTIITTTIAIINTTTADLQKKCGLHGR